MKVHNLTARDIQPLISKAQQLALPENEFSLGERIGELQLFKDGRATLKDVNIKGNIERNDIHWITFFESLDGFSNTQATLSEVYLALQTEALLNTIAQVAKLPTYTPFIFDWGKDRKIRTKIFFGNIISNQEVQIFSGGQGILEHIGFRVTNNEIFGSVADGSAETQTAALLTLSGSTSYALEAITRNGETEFFIDEVSYGKITSGHPTGSTNSEQLLDIHIKTTNGTAKLLRISFWDFWQSK